MNKPSYYRSPQQLLDQLGIMEPEDIDIEVIAYHCAATVLYKPLRGCSARIVGRGERARIVVNAFSSRQRQRFSAGHELGHWMHDRGKVAFSCEDLIFETEWSDHNPEVRANQYASDLLLPTTMFKPLARNRAMTFETVTDLAITFQTSLTATAFRLVEHGSFPAMLVCNAVGKRKWFLRGPDVPEVLWPRDVPGKDTVAHDVLSGSQTEGGSLDVYADQWVTRQGADAYAVHEDSIRISNGLVLSLLWWKNERQLIEIEAEEERRAARRADGNEEW